jgi:hypothetical protein
VLRQGVAAAGEQPGQRGAERDTRRCAALGQRAGARQLGCREARRRCRRGAGGPAADRQWRVRSRAAPWWSSVRQQVGRLDVAVAEPRWRLGVRRACRRARVARPAQQRQASAAGRAPSAATSRARIDAVASAPWSIAGRSLRRIGRHREVTDDARPAGQAPIANSRSASLGDAGHEHLDRPRRLPSPDRRRTTTVRSGEQCSRRSAPRRLAGGGMGRCRGSWRTGPCALSMPAEGARRWWCWTAGEVTRNCPCTRGGLLGAGSRRLPQQFSSPTA